MSQPLIYVVDDEPLITRLAQINLEHAGYRVAMAYDGQEALQALQGGEVQPDLLLLDVMMPYMDGFALLEQMQADEKLAHIPVVFMTARSRDDDVILGRHLGAEQYVTKPINPLELVAIVEKVLKRE